ncbi:hypothetical protein FOL47_001649 [Perkinsus chesapeaki]|uniref:Carbonic anhydrase n=1 Tax=Perkinsus chesapeaki TaxID=330153 RepID=A0A7J6N1G1_PERCH|nr:hypothetical protein FOL47_001649 [Perkinsus chesapeaki]
MNYGIANNVSPSLGPHLEGGIDPNENWYLSGVFGFTNDRYRLAQLHYHWGSNDSTGSEHYLNGNSFPAELHMVHHNMKYSNLSAAAGKEGGIAVLGVLLRIGASNAGVEALLSSLAENRTKFSVDLAGLIPSDGATNYYTYNGSFTVPPCTEHVSWIVAGTELTISETQLARLRALTINGNPVGPNYRALAPQNEERILTGGRNGDSSYASGLFLSYIVTSLIFSYSAYVRLL